MFLRVVLSLCLFASATLAPLRASACTCFFLTNQAAAHFARNYDWFYEGGTLTINKRGVAKRAFSFEAPAEWTSRFGSVTFNQYGREFPNDGMNEAGLTVAVMWLGYTQYPPADGRPTVGSAQWVQYQLDTAETVADVLASDAAVRISASTGGLVHYLVADATGAAAVIEWIGGERVVHTGEGLTAAALSNSTYKRSLEFLRQAQRSASPQAVGYSRGSLGRFVTAARAVAEAAEADDWTIDQTFRRLAAADQPGRTQWSIVYDLRNRAIEFKTRSAATIKRVTLGALDLSAETPTQVLSLATAEPGDVAPRLEDFDTERNLREINAAFDATAFLRPFPAAMREKIAKYPEADCRPVLLAPAAAAP